MRLPRLACVALSLVVATACGSTLPTGSTASSAGGEELVASDGLAIGDGSAATGTAGGSAGGPGSTRSTVAGAPGAAGAPPGPSGASGSRWGNAPQPGGGVAGAPLPAPGGRGPITVGFEFVDASGGAAAAGAIGAAGVSAGDQKRTYQILVDQANKAGGLLGRKIVPVFFGYNPTGSDLATQEQAMCARFTQDNKVFAAAVLPITSPTGLNCLQKAGAVIIGQGLGSTFDDELYRKYPNLVSSGALSLDALAEPWSDGLARQDFFKGATAIGLVAADDPAFVRFARGAMPRALARHGQKFKKVAIVPSATTVNDLGQTAPAVQNAVLQFRSEGIDRVLFIAPVGGVTQLFLQNAESQGYRPRYGLSTADELFKLQGTASASQLAGSVGIGWFPLYDVQSSTVTLGPTAKRCTDTLAKGGINQSDQNATSIALAICDQVATLLTAARLGGAPDARSFVRGLNKAGRSIPTAAHFRLDFAGRKDGISAVRDLSFGAGCSCFKYAGSEHPA